MWKIIKEFWERHRLWRRMERAGQLGTRKRRTDSFWTEEADRSPVISVVMAGLLLAMCIGLLSITELHEYPKLVAHQLAPTTLFAQVDFSFEDKAATEQARQKAADNQVHYLRLSAKRSNQVRHNLELLFETVRQRNKVENAGQVYVAPDVELAQRVAALSPSAFQLVFSIVSDSVLAEQFFNEIKDELSHGILNRADLPEVAPDAPVRIIDGEGRELRERKLDSLPTLDDTVELLTNLILSYRTETKIIRLDQQALAQLVRSVFHNSGNLEPDLKLGKERLAETLQKVPPVLIEVKRNDVIVRRNDVVDERILDALEAHDKLLAQMHDQLVNRRQKVVENACWSLLLILFAGFYLKHIHPEVMKSSRNVALVVTVTMVSIGCNYLAVDAFYSASSALAIPPVLVTDALPLALAAVLLTVMAGYRVALYAGFFVAMISAMMLNGSFSVALEGLTLSAICGMVVRPSRNYRSFFVRIFTSVLVIVLFLDFNLWEYAVKSPIILGYAAALAVANALFTALAALLLTFLFELVFNVSTNMSLMVLCDFNHPLLKELHLRAPGTSQHSQNVAMLAENAALEIGANAVRARAGALFHDIGKIKNPEYFIENNLSGANPHDKLTPRMSSLIIGNHVKDGLDLALQYKLCRVVRDAIQQHHGTDLIQYFYHLAMQGDEPVLESDYRYPGPLPHSKEVVLVSLADACEAACRSLEKPTASKIEAMVKDIFRKRWREGQLDDAELTVKELAIMCDSFVRTLTTMHHSRIAYPKDENDDENNVLVEERPAAVPDEETAP